tara:strand:- start:155 stop:496 length:342 start_codon:yes stop_codon:yes gene_type:complete
MIMKNAIRYITRAAEMEASETGLRGKHQYLSALAKHVNAELKRVEKQAIATGNADRHVTGKRDLAPNRDLYIELHGVQAWEKNKRTTNSTSLVWSINYDYVGADLEEYPQSDF